MNELMNLETESCDFQVLMFDTISGRTCLHYAAYYGHSSCLKAILSAAQSSPVAASWFALFCLTIDFDVWCFSMCSLRYLVFLNSLQGVCTVCEY